MATGDPSSPGHLARTANCQAGLREEEARAGRPHVPSLVVQPRAGPPGPGGRERSTARRALRQQPPVWVIGAKSAP